MSINHSDHPDEPVDDLLEQAVRAMKQEPIPAGPSADAIAATLKALRKREQTSKLTILSIPRSRFMRIAKAGSGLLLTSCVVIALLTLRSPASAYAQVIEQARKAKSMSYLLTIRTSSLLQPAVVREFVAEDGRSRTELTMNGKPSGTVTITDAAGFVRLTLSDFSTAATVVPVPPLKMASVYPAREGVRAVEGGTKNSWLRSLQSLKDKPEKDLGEKQIEGKTTHGFEAVYGKIRFELWVDVTTGKPVRIEYRTPSPFSHQVTMSDFRFDERLDESLFSFEPPAGYVVHRIPATPEVAGGEESLLIALHGYTSKSGGRFPASLTEWGEWATLLTEGNRTGVPDSEAMRILANLGAVTPFLTGMESTDFAYRGKGRTMNDRETIVFWYRKPEGTYRAIYGDLSVKNITLQDIPKD